MYRNPNKNSWTRKKRRAGLALFFLLLVLAAGGLVQWLWNAILPEVLPAKALNYGQALGLIILCRILFGSIRFGYRAGSPFSRHPQGFRGKWLNMSEEERAAFKEQWRKRCEHRKE
ncbi:hypothetical protein [Adhaeribacter radiodurans]|uniref:Uncharacterized protein n=1 Tax=Adhaeribacter radiodurans TaxID=2745197 RepID=A0A7L7L6L6_9BACT|nr:hypothetical protein [Adhaeribacter radiodurans]QMU28448.1 hypothetical protein HUW48_10540 [Adhaeribacter radiodurans]